MLKDKTDNKLEKKTTKNLFCNLKILKNINRKHRKKEEKTKTKNEVRCSSNSNTEQYNKETK